MIHLEVNCNFRTEPKCDCKISAWVIQSVAWGSIGLLVIKRIIYLFPQELHSVAALQSASSLQNKLEPFHALFYFPTVVYSGNVFQFYYEKKIGPLWMSWRQKLAQIHDYVDFEEYFILLETMFLFFEKQKAIFIIAVKSSLPLWTLTGWCSILWITLAFSFPKHLLRLSIASQR